MSKIIAMDPITPAQSAGIAGGGQLQEATLAHAVHIADSAAAAFWDWSRTTFEHRNFLLGRIADTLDQSRERFAKLVAYETGASSAWTNFNIDLAIRMLHESQAIGPMLQPSRLADKSTGVESTLAYSAAGVVLSIAPWNAPLILATRAIALPLACGNTVVLKGSEHCPRTHEALVHTFSEAGLPEGVVGFVANEPDVAEPVVTALIEHPAVRRINFTGSTRVGRELAVHAARQLKPCLLALSDKAAMIVLEDADIKSAVHAAIYGAFFNQGQICMATERVIVLDSIADKFSNAMQEQVGQLKAADPAVEEAALGRLVSQEAAARVRYLIDDAVAQGAELLVGGEVSGAVMQPAVVDRVSSAMRLYHEEVFGPVASILRVQDEEEALSIANDSRYGLTAAIFSKDISRARDLAERLETGIVQINGPTVFDDPRMPFGGMKDSGYGRFGARAAVREFTELRWIAEHPPGSVPSLVPSTTTNDVPSNAMKNQSKKRRGKKHD